MMICYHALNRGGVGNCCLRRGENRRQEVWQGSSSESVLRWALIQNKHRDGTPSELLAFSKEGELDASAIPIYMNNQGGV